MATVLTSETPQPKHGRPSCYPWDTWFDGQCWRLEVGVDIRAVSVDQMIARVRQRACRMKVSVSIERDGENAIRIQAK